MRALGVLGRGWLGNSYGIGGFCFFEVLETFGSTCLEAGFSYPEGFFRLVFVKAGIIQQLNVRVHQWLNKAVGGLAFMLGRM